jgi:hypothetical protein
MNGARGAPETRQLNFNCYVAVIFAGVTVYAFLPFVTAAIRASRLHQVFLGAAGFYPQDTLQYLAWVRDAQNGLVRNLYGSVGRAVFIHPMWSPSGWVQALTGVSDAIIVAFWKAVAVVILVWGLARVVATQIADDRPRRRVALLFALVAGVNPLVVVASKLVPSWRAPLGATAIVMIPAASLWDWTPLAIAIGLMCLTVVRIQRLLECRSTLENGGQLSPWLVTAALGLLTSWLHPWQGESLIFFAAGLYVYRLRGTGLRVRLAHGANSHEAATSIGGTDRRALLGVTLFVCATALPILYYLILGYADSGWATGRASSVRMGGIVFPDLLLYVAPLALLPVLVRSRARGDYAVRSLIIWLLADALTLLVTGADRFRALEGTSIPVLILLVKLWPEYVGRKRWQTWAGLVCALAPTAYLVVHSHHVVFGYSQREILPPDDLRAARAASPISGAHPILTEAELGLWIPALTDHATWVGHPYWTPDYSTRVQRTSQLIEGQLTVSEATKLVRSADADAIIEPCGFRKNIEAVLRPAGFTRRQFGCATLYTRQ